MADKKFKFKRAATIQVPDEFFHPLVTQIKSVDEAWSEIGGIVPSQVTFITGMPGAGKTTLSLAIGACIAKSTPVAFISLEMSEFQLANQAKKIPGFGGVHVTGDFDQDQTLEAIRELKPGLIILDSIQKAARKMKEESGRPMPHDRAQYEIVSMFTAYAKKTWTSVFLIGHCDKSGNYKGPSDLLHDVDSHLLVSYDKEMDVRTFSFGKNRFGGIMEDGLFGITRDTVWIGSPYIATVFSDAVITPTVPKPIVEAAAVEHSPDVAYSIDQLGKTWSGSNARVVIDMVVEKLKREDPDFAANTFVKSTNRVSVRYGGNTLAHCHYNSGELVFGKKIFTKMELGKIRYKKEQKHINARCKTSADLLIWVVIHEWMHFYKGLQEHNNHFFDEVAKKYDWFIDSI